MTMLISLMVFVSICIITNSVLKLEPITSKVKIKMNIEKMMLSKPGFCDNGSFLIFCDSMTVFL